MKIEGSKINLRNLDKLDAASITEHIQDKEISEFTYIPHPYSLKDAYEFINHTAQVNDDKSGFHLGIEKKENNQIIGGIGLNTISHTHKKAELGYWISKIFWNKGYVTEAINLMVSYCFTKFDLVRIHAYVRPGNPASIKALEKCSFKEEGLLRKHQFQNGDHRDFYIYSILKEEIE